MKPKSKIALLLAFPGLASITSLQAQTWIAGAGDFRVNTNWSPANVPGAGGTASIDNGGTASIGVGPQLDVGKLLLGGNGTGAANVVGNLTINGGVTLLSSSLNADSFVGNVALDRNTVGTSTLIMNGGEIQVDDPAGVSSGKSGLSKRFDYTNTGTNTWDTSGKNNKDLLVGIRTRGQLELHGTSRIYLGDDLGIGNSSGAGGNEATVIMDGTSLVAIGSGTEIGKTDSIVTMTLSGQARLVSGNSLGPGNPLGQTDEGYITLGTRDSGQHTVTLSDSAEFQCMTFQNRLGTTTIDLTGNSKLRIYNVFSGSGTILATRPSYISSGAVSNTLIRLRNSSSMLVDCKVGNAASGGSNMVNGLHVSGGENLQSGVVTDIGTYNSTLGGTAVLDLADTATLDIKQSLHLAFGFGASANSTLRITGPGPIVSIGGNLNLAFNEYYETIAPGTGNRPGSGILEYVITGPTLAPIVVGGAARIANGALFLTLNGSYTPPLGTRYTLITAGSVNGPFRFVDTSQAPLNGTDVWKIDVSGSTVTATVSHPYLTIQTDATNATLTWPGPSILQFSPDLTTPFVDVPEAFSPYFSPLDAAKKFYRLRY